MPKATKTKSKVVSIPKKVSTPTFDPKKDYSWTAEQEVLVTGLDYSLMYNMLTQELSTDESKLVLSKYQLHQRLAAILKREVEAGNFQEKTAE